MSELAAFSHPYRRWWIVLTPLGMNPPPVEPAPQRGPRLLPESNESVRAILALERQINDGRQLSAVPGEEKR